MKTPRLKNSKWASGAGGGRSIHYPPALEHATARIFCRITYFNFHSVFSFVNEIIMRSSGGGGGGLYEPRIILQ